MLVEKLWVKPCTTSLNMINLDILYTEKPILFILQGNERAILISQRGNSPRRVLGNQPACHSLSLDGILTKMTSLSQQATVDWAATINREKKGISTSAVSL